MAFKAVINTIEYELFGKFDIQEKLGNVISTTIEILVPYGTRVPRAQDIIRVVDDSTFPDTVYFIGVAGIPSSPKFDSFQQVPKYKIKCQNANSILRRRITNFVLTNVNTTEIIDFVYDTYIQGEGIAKGTISSITDVTYDIYVAPNLDLQKVLNELADQAGAVWGITNDYEFFFITVDDYPKFTETIDTVYIFGNNLNHKTTGLDVRTVQVIEGATETTDEQTESFTYDGNTNEFIVSFPIILKPTILINDVVVPSANVGVKGLNDDDPTIYFLFANNSPSVSYNPDSAALSVSDNVKIQYFGEYPIRIEALNQSRINEISQLTGTSGIIENVISDTSIKNATDGQNLAESLLENFEFERDEVFWTLHTQNLRLFGLTLNDFPIGVQITFNLPDIGLVGDFVVVERRISPESLNDVVNNLKCRLKLQNRNLLRSYGESFNSLEKQLRSISVRADQIIIQTLRINETLTMTEETIFTQVFEYYPTSSGVGDIFEPGWFPGDGGAFPI